MISTTPGGSSGSTPSASGAALITFAKGPVASDDRVTATTSKEYKTAQTYDGKSYSYGAKLNSKGSLTITLEASYTVKLVMGTDKSGYTNVLTIDGTVITPSDNVVTTTLAKGSHTVIYAGAETYVFLIILE